ncbi:META domain-containing protein [Streptomyces sp. NPDC056716]|uniref:META domain-containing protein n=1 Tax=unclassified Streptomyces TaxID=2593676 RepID=UPI0036945F7A
MYRKKQLDPSGKTRRLTLTAVALLPLAAACGTDRSGSASVGAPPPVTGVHWNVESVTVDGTTQDAPAGAHVTIDAGGGAQGNYGCNHFTAQAEFDGDRVRLGDATMTEMACADEPMAFERTLAATLAAGALTTEITGDRLTLTTDAGDTVRLTEERPAGLYGTKWNVTALGATGADSTTGSLPGPAAPHLTFDRETGAVSGNLGCNQVNAQATVGDGVITLGTPSTTRMMCDASLMDTEKTLLRLFDATAEYRLDHRTLTLTSENGETVTAVADQ